MIAAAILCSRTQWLNEVPHTPRKAPAEPPQRFRIWDESIHWDLDKTAEPAEPHREYFARSTPNIWGLENYPNSECKLQAGFRGFRKTEDFCGICLGGSARGSAKAGEVWRHRGMRRRLPVVAAAK
jgi:hypothetical protein